MSATTSVLIKTHESEVRTSPKNNKNYKVVTFTEAGLKQTPWGLKQIPLSQAKSSALVCWEENINGKMDAGYAEPIFNKNNPDAGGYFFAALVTRATAAYEIPSSSTPGQMNTVHSATVLVYGDTADKGFEVLVQKAFKAKKLVLNTASEEHATQDETAGVA